MLKGSYKLIGELAKCLQCILNTELSHLSNVWKCLNAHALFKVLS